MPDLSATAYIVLAKGHLERVRDAWEDPGIWEEPDWLELATFGFYCLEAAVMAGGMHVGWAVEKSHPGKVKAAKKLAAEKNLPDVSQLMRDLNEARKSKAYGDVIFPDLDPGKVASEIQAYVDAVDALLGT